MNTFNVLWRKVRPYIPEPLLTLVRPMRYLWLRVHRGYRECYEKWSPGEIAKYKPIPIPPPALRQRVHGSAELAGFVSVGRQLATDIEQALQDVGRPLHSFKRVLDFGCGCGRVLTLLSQQAAGPVLFGTDVDKDAIEWCRGNVTYARFGVNNSLPPTDYEDGYFDLIFSISVFTHLDEGHQLAWFQELRRLLSPDGVFLFTVHGPPTWHGLHKSDIQRLSETGFLFQGAYNTAWAKAKKVFADWYGTSFITENYIRNAFGPPFELIKYVPQGANSHQDIVIVNQTRTAMTTTAVTPQEFVHL